jgi:hypothetical protein
MTDEQGSRNHEEPEDRQDDAAPGAGGQERRGPGAGHAGEDAGQLSEEVSRAHQASVNQVRHEPVQSSHDDDRHQEAERRNEQLAGGRSRRPEYSAEKRTPPGE